MYDAGKTDAFSKLIFVLARGVCFLMVAVCCVAFVVGGIMYLNAGPERLQAPEFKSFLPYLGLPGERPVDQDFSSIDTKRAIENKYDQHMKRIVTEYRFETPFYAQLVDWMAQVPENRRTRFIDGLYVFLGGLGSWVKQNQEALKLDTAGEHELTLNMARKYQTIFMELLRKEQDRQQASAQERSNLLLFIVSSLVFLVLFLLVPVLLKIEENTRFFK